MDLRPLAIRNYNVFINYIYTFVYTVYLCVVIKLFHVRVYQLNFTIVIHFKTLLIIYQLYVAHWHHKVISNNVN